MCGMRVWWSGEDGNQAYLLSGVDGEDAVCSVNDAGQAKGGNSQSRAAYSQVVQRLGTDLSRNVLGF